MSIPCNDIISCFNQMLTDKWGYIPATAGTMWTQAKQNATTNAMAKKYGSKWIGHRVADCSGAFVYVYKKYGLSIYHGSNRIARKYVVELLPISEAKPGMAAFKFYKPGEKGYQLPEDYKPGGSQYNGDLNDYYHIGLVDENPKYILNSATTINGFIRSKISNGWNACGYLKAVDYEGKDDDEPVYDNNIMIVTSENGKAVNMRSTASLTANIVATVPVGTEVNAIGENSNGWVYIQYKTKKGWMMSKFLVQKGSAPPTDAVEGVGTDAGNDTHDEEAKALEAYRSILKESKDRLLAEIDVLNGLVSSISNVLDRFSDSK